MVSNLDNLVGQWVDSFKSFAFNGLLGVVQVVHLLLVVEGDWTLGQLRLDGVELLGNGGGSMKRACRECGVDISERLGRTVMCLRCANTSDGRRYRKHRLSGMCGQCGAPTAPSRAVCQKHLEMASVGARKKWARHKRWQAGQIRVAGPGRKTPLI